MLTVNLANRLEDFTKFFLTSTFLLCLEVFVSRPRYLILHKFQKSCSHYCKRGKIIFPTILPGSLAEVLQSGLTKDKQEKTIQMYSY